MRPVSPESLRIPKIVSLSHKWPWRELVLFGLVGAGTQCRTEGETGAAPKQSHRQAVASHRGEEGRRPTNLGHRCLWASASNWNDKQGKLVLLLLLWPNCWPSGKTHVKHSGLLSVSFLSTWQERKTLNCSINFFLRSLTDKVTRCEWFAKFTQLLIS